MTWFEAVILGIIQGLTEFLPISSTGHLAIGRHAFGLKEAGLFLDTMLHVGTLAAVVYFYREELLQFVKNPFGRVGKLLIVGTIPAAAVGLLFEDMFESLSDSGVSIGWEFLATGLFLWFADSARRGSKNMDEIRPSDAFVIGIFQAGAIFPAVSRSALTIAGGLWRGLNRETAAYFSFLLSIPAIAGGVLVQGAHLFDGTAGGGVDLAALLAGAAAAAVFGYIAVRWMIGYLKRGSLKMFAVYVWALGAVVLAAQWLGRW